MTEDLEDMTKDELLERAHIGLSIVVMSEFAGVRNEKNDRAYDAVNEELKRRYGWDNRQVREETGKWVKDKLRENYERSYCAQCPENPGFETLIGMDAHEGCQREIFLRSVIYGFPETKEDCHRAKDLGAE